MTDPVDHDAREMAREALVRIEGHEKLCADRWEQLRRTVNKMMWLLIGMLLTVIVSFVVPKPALGHGAVLAEYQHARPS